MKPEISIIGTGALGSALARELSKKGFQLKSLFNRTVSEAEALGRQLKVELAGSFPSSENDIGRLLFLTVPDDTIRDVVDQLANRIEDFTGLTVAHCSGNHTSNILEPLKKRGASTAAFHPIQTFTEGSKPGIFKDIYISLEGDDPAVGLLQEIAVALNSNPVPLSREAKPYLHAGAVMASNYLIALLEAAGKISEMGGVEPMVARKALMPLVKTALENASDSDLPDALSGPIARGDVDTVRKHLELLEPNPGLLSLYKQLGLRTLELARQKRDTNNADELKTLEEMFRN